MKEEGRGNLQLDKAHDRTPCPKDIHQEEGGKRRGRTPYNGKDGGKRGGAWGGMPGNL